MIENNIFLWILLLCIVTYLIGSLPIIYWAAKVLAHEDIRDFGSRNPGGTNFIRRYGPKVGIFVLILDMSKGILSSALVIIFFPSNWWLALTCLACSSAAAGVRFSPFLKFKGGKSVAVFFGGLLIIFGPLIWGLMILALFIIWICFFRRRVSLVSLSLAASTIFLIEIDPQFMYLIPASYLIWWNHWENIKRLNDGKEPPTPNKPLLIDKADIPNLFAGLINRIRSPK